MNIGNKNLGIWGNECVTEVLQYDSPNPDRGHGAHVYSVVLVTLEY